MLKNYKGIKMNETKEFVLWKKDNLEDLKRQYRNYLKYTIIEDEDFDVEATEDFQEWCEVEFDRLKEIEGEEHKDRILNGR